MVCCPALLEVPELSMQRGHRHSRAACVGQQPDQWLASGQGSAQHSLGIESSRGEALQPDLLWPHGMV